MDKDRKFGEINAEFERNGHALDVSERPSGGWLASYRPHDQDYGTAAAHDGRMKLEAAEHALAVFRAKQADQDIANSLANPPSPATLAVREMENRFRDASDLVERFLTEGASSGKGAAVTATLHLAARTLADLRCGQYLVSNGFVIQMASVVRPAMEALNLIDLFAQDPGAAQRWAEGIDNNREFRASKVRDTLGLGANPVYSRLSEISHPRHTGFQMTSLRIVGKDEPTDAVPVLRAIIGGLPLEFAHVLITTMLPGHVLCRLGLGLRHCEVKTEVKWTAPTVARQIPETLKPGYEAIVRLIDQRTEAADVAERMLAIVDETISLTRETEAIVREGRERQSLSPSG